MNSGIEHRAKCFDCGGFHATQALCQCVGAQHHDRGRGLFVGARERRDDLVLHRGIDGVELVGAIERDDADFLVGLVADRHTPIDGHDRQYRGSLARAGTAGDPDIESVFRSR